MASHITEALCDRVDIITLFWLALMVERGATPFPKDIHAAKILLQHVANLGHEGAKQNLLELPDSTATTYPPSQMFGQAVRKPEVLPEAFLQGPCVKNMSHRRWCSLLDIIWSV